MSDMQRVAGYAALVQGLLILIVAIMFATVLPAEGFSTDTDFTNWSKLVPVMSTYNIVNAVAIVRSVVFLAVILGVAERVQTGAPALVRVALAGACIGSTLFLVQGMLGVVAWPGLLHSESASVAGTAVQVISNTLATSGIVAQGWVIFLIGWSAWRGRHLSLPLSGITVLTGLLGMASFLHSEILLAAMTLTIVWTFWLGVELLRPGTRGHLSAMPADQHATMGGEKLHVSTQGSWLGRQ